MLRQIGRQQLTAMALLAIALVVLAIGIVSYYQAQNRLAQNQQQLQNERRRYETGLANQSSLQRYYPAFRQWQEAALIGGESRLDWTEQLHAVVQQYQIPGAEFAIEHQSSFHDFPEELDVSDIDVRRSTMKLDLTFSHQGQLITLLEQLQQAPGLFIPQQCHLNREPAPTEEPQQRPVNYKGWCTLDWLSIQPKGLRGL